MTTVTLQTTYFGPVQWYQKLNRYDHCMLEQYDSYQKQTYRNRCIIAAVKDAQHIICSLIDQMDCAAVHIQYRHVPIDLHTVNQLIFHHICLSYMKTAPRINRELLNMPVFFLHQIITYVRKPDCQQCRKSCMQTDRKPGTHRSRRL